MTKVKFEVPGKPVGKQRPRLSYRYGHAMAYTPQKTKDYESLVRRAYLENEVYRDNYTGAVGIKVNVKNTPPPSTPQERKERLIKGEYKMTKPDLDNVLKSILDGLNGIAFKDDNQVVEISANKKYGKKDLVQIELIYFDKE